MAGQETSWSVEPAGEPSLARLRRGDREAFEKMYRAHRGRVAAVVRKVLRDPAEAEDVTQDIFLAVLYSVRRFDGRAQLSTWLYRVALNRALNRLRDLGRRARLMSSEEARQVAAIDDLVAVAERRTWVRRAVAFLGPDRRLLVTLRDIEGRSYDEIARIARLPEGTVKSRLHRARAELAARLRHRVLESTA